MSDQQTMYRAFFGFQGLSMWHPDSPAPHFHSEMTLSPCGQYLSVQRRRMDDSGWETTREEMSDYWQPTREQALAAVAPRLRAIGERLIEQALELERAAQPERRERPALAEVAATSGDMGSQAEGGE
jgi:hypothetical protein